MKNWFSKKEETPKADDIYSDLSKVLYRVPCTSVDITNRDAVEGTIITGAPGSGKTSAVGQYLALAMLEAGYGFCVLCTKPDERVQWEKYVEKAGRKDDLVIFNKSSPYEFNFLQYELTRKGEGAGDSLVIANYLMSVYEIAKNFQAGGKGEDGDKFWDQSLRRLIIRGISLLKLAQKPLTIENLRQLVVNSFDAKDLDRYHELKFTMSDKKGEEDDRIEASEKFNKWKEDNFFLEVIETARNRADKTDEEKEELKLAWEFWLTSFVRLADKTKSIVVESFYGLVEVFTSGILKQKFSKGLSKELLPESTYLEKKIVLIDFPVKEFGISGLYAASIYKVIFQAAMERRNIRLDQNRTIVGLWVDEFHHFINPEADTLFMTTARSSRTACVFITQNLNNIKFSMGRNNTEARAMSLLGNIGLKYFCSNADAQTNEWGAKMIGQHYIDLANMTIKDGDQISRNYTQQLHYKVPPEHFTSLQTGGEKRKVQVIVFKAGKVWGNNGENYAEVTFTQEFL